MTLISTLQAKSKNLTVDRIEPFYEMELENGKNKRNCANPLYGLQRVSVLISVSSVIQLGATPNR